MNDNKMTPGELRATWGLGTVFSLRMLGMFMVHELEDFVLWKSLYRLISEVRRHRRRITQNAGSPGESLIL